MADLGGDRAIKKESHETFAWAVSAWCDRTTKITQGDSIDLENKVCF